MRVAHDEGTRDSDGTDVRHVGVGAPEAPGGAATSHASAWYRAAMDAMDLAFHLCEVIVDDAGRGVDYRILDVNPAWARMTGLDPVAAVGRTAIELLPQPAEWIEACARAGLLRETVRVEQEIPALGMWFDVHLVPFGAAGGRQFLATAADVTARKRAEADHDRLQAAVAAERERLRSLILHMPAPLALLDGPEHRYVVVNEAYRRVSGPRPDVLGRTLRDAFPELAGQGLYEQFDRVYATGEPWSAPETLVRYDRDGTGSVDTWWDLRIDPVRAVGDGGTPGPVTGVLLFNVEVTAQVRARRELERLLDARIAADEALRAVEARQRFLLTLEDRLRPLADPEQVQYAAAHALGEHLGADRVGYAEAEPDGEHIVVTRNYVDGVPGIEGRYRYDDYGAGLLRELAAGRTVLRPDVARDPARSDAEREAHAVLQLGATVNVPLHKDGRLVAVLFLHFREAHAFAEDEVVLLQMVAERTWAAVARARAEAAVRESEARYRTLFERMGQGFCVIEVLFDPDDPARAVDYRFVETNAAFVRQTGMVGVVGRTARELVPDLEPHWFETYGRVARTGTPTRLEATVGAWGRSFDLEAYRVGEASERRVAVLFTDVTAERAASAERERLLSVAEHARTEAEAANRAKGDFLAVMSHELRTPLNAIGGYTELLELGIRGPVTSQQLLDLGRIQASQRHLLGLINEVLNYAKLEAGAVPFVLTEVPIREALEAAASLLGPQARARGLTLTVEECAPDLAVRADADKMRQVLLNLLSNAIKFTEPGGRVTVACTLEDGPVVPVPQGADPAEQAAARVLAIRVADSGIGIPEDKRATIFEPFVQVRADLTRVHEGTGLGLAISRDLARGMGGDLSVESTPGTGSVFTFTLPVA